MEKNTWIEAVLASAETVKFADPKADLYEKIQQKIKEEQVSTHWGISIAAAFIVLIGVNLFFVFHQKNTEKFTQVNTEVTYILTSNQLYSYDKN
jgi:ABC-type glycerol-3-phosphate transport system permease component